VNAAVIGNIESIPLGGDAFGEELVAVDARIGIIEIAMRDHRPVICDMRIIALHENAGGAETTRLDGCKIADRYIVCTGEDAVREVAGGRQVPKVNNPLARRGRHERIFIEARRGDVLEVDLCHHRLLLQRASFDLMSHHCVAKPNARDNPKAIAPVPSAERFICSTRKSRPRRSRNRRQTWLSVSLGRRQVVGAVLNCSESNARLPHINLRLFDPGRGLRSAKGSSAEMLRRFK
jgi:hypothetical protein